MTLRVTRAVLAPALLITLFLCASAATRQVACEGQKDWAMTVDVTVYPDGWADVSLIVDLSGEEAFVVLPVLGEPDLLLVTDGDGLPLNYTLEGDVLAVETLGASRVVASYQTSSLTSREGGVWEVTVDLDQADEVAIRIPGDAAIVGLSSAPEDLVPGADWVTLTFDGGSAWVAYVLEAPEAALESAQAGAEVTPQPEEGEGLLEEQVFGLPLLWVAAAVGVLILLLAAVLAVSRR